MRGNKMYSLSAMAIACLLALVPAQPFAAQGRSGKCTVSATLTFRDDPGDAARSDGGVTYPVSFGCDGGNGFLLCCDQRFVFELNNQKSGAPFTLGPTPAVGANLGVEIADGFTSLAVGESAETTKIQFNFVIGNSRYFLRWGASNNWLPGMSTVMVTRTAEDTWVIETSPAPNNVAALHECPAKGACKTPIDRSYYASLKMTLVSQP